MVAESSTAEIMAALVAQKFDLRLDRDRELIRQLIAIYLIEGFQIPPPCYWE
jgi:hypothetical protein